MLSGTPLLAPRFLAPEQTQCYIFGRRLDGALLPLKNFNDEMFIQDYNTMKYLSLQSEMMSMATLVLSVLGPRILPNLHSAWSKGYS